MRLKTIAAAVCLLTMPAQASSLYVKYDISLTGLKIGEGALSVDLNDKTYRLHGQGNMAAFGNFVSDGSGSVHATGSVSPAGLLPASFTMQAEEEGKPNTVTMTMAKGSVTGRQIHPAQDRMNERVKVTEAHKRGVIDPLSAVLFPAPRGLHRDSCNRTVAIYDGRDRYDVVLSYKAKYQMTGRGKRYSGGVLACKARYRPISGHRPNRKTIQQLAANKTMEVHLAEVPGKPYLLLYKASLMTPVGPLNVQNVKFKKMN
ncbi:DUF3108 domain-containing protein [Labrenzia sp. PHM005]|uniref:DUF3108 domain-containing protein n=1 Tax=Labrenzia sp. PHM005 TaxID=2590016 RepID=UPI00113FFC61|nr:DUF3108 domain-containing protein [Labrenzia sp. PHM005]QDG78279.1 DUF3108 domain-containing protein [Labrenzia sp. PHM005]